MPASSTISANNSEDSGAISDGFKIMVQPVASAGITLSVTWFIGQFHGVIRPQTPAGSIRIRSFGACEPNSRSNSNDLAARMKFLICAAPAPACAAFARAIGAPISNEIASPISSARAA